LRPRSRSVAERGVGPGLGPLPNRPFGIRP
jgi:hypothetical protein